MDARSGWYVAVRGAQINRERTGGKRFDGCGEIRRRGVITLQEKGFDRPSLEHLAHDPQERNQIVAARPPMHDVAKELAVAARIELADESSRRLLQNFKKPFDRLQHTGHA